MNELVTMLSQRLGLPESTARQAVEIVIGFLKDKLPAPIAGQIDGILSGQSPAAGADDAIDKAKGMLGGLFGDKK